MTDGPWGSRDGRPAPAASAVSETPVAAPALEKGQNPVVAIVSTAILGGFIWWTTGSWVVAVAALFGLFVHEYGHVLAMNRLGMGPARIHIIPFLGGLAKGQRAPKSEWDGVLVALAGPAFGLLAVLPAVGLWVATRDPAWMLGAFFIAMINLVNLAPAPPLDGSKALGPVLARVHPMLEMGALLLVGAVVLWWAITTGRTFLAIFLGIALLGYIRRGAWRVTRGKLSWGQAAQSLGLFLLTGLLCAGVAISVLLPLAEGSVDGALDIAGRFIGVER